MDILKKTLFWDKWWFSCIWTLESRVPYVGWIWWKYEFLKTDFWSYFSLEGHLLWSNISKDLSWNFNFTSRIPENSQKCGFLKNRKLQIFTKIGAFFSKNVVKNRVSWCIWVTYTLYIWFQPILDTFFLKSFKNGPFLVKLKMFKEGFNHVPDLARKNPSEFK